MADASDRHPPDAGPPSPHPPDADPPDAGPPDADPPDADPHGPDPTDHDPESTAGRHDPGRRRFLRGAGLSAAALLSGGVGGAMTGRSPAVAGAPGDASPPHVGHGGPGPGTTGTGAVGPYAAGAPGGRPGGVVGGSPGTAAVYGHGIQPPIGLASTALDAATRPPPPGSAPGRHDIAVVETTATIAEGVTVDQWTYDGTAPGPVLRATEGERLSVTVHNHTARDHNLHLHGRHSPQMDGWEPIPPGESFTYEVEAGPAGVHPYHCHTMPLADHLAKGLYGAFIVDPAPPREPAHEVVLLLSGWDLDGDRRNEVYTYNGVAGFFVRHPITVPVGELVRVFVLNLVEYDPIASFHLHAQTFDVFSTGTATTPDAHTDTISLVQGERAIVEFRLPERGRYMFHPHQHHMAEAGAMGWFAAI